LKEWLVDVPVITFIWIRSNCQRQQFEVLKQVRPRILFIASDGGRNELEWKEIILNRKMFEDEIDWDCTVHYLYEDENIGMYSMGMKALRFVWSKVDRCIFLEDDIVPSVSFFRYCTDLLEKYKDDLRISCICGMNHLGVSDNVNSDYFFSREGSIWGFATWKRMWDQSNGYTDFEYGNDPYVLNCLKQRTKHYKLFWKRVAGYPKNKYYGGHIPGSEFFISFSVYGQNQLQIIPKYNMISNIGCTKDSSHSDEIKTLPPTVRKMFNAKTYEIEFPLKEAKYVIPDIEYEKKRNRISGLGNPVINYWRNVQRTFLIIRYQGWSRVSNKFRNYIKNKFNNGIMER
jgi:hypothetical protein